MRVKRRFSTRWGHPYHLPGACAKCRQTLLRPRCFIPSMIPETYMEWPAQNKGEDPSELSIESQDLSCIAAPYRLIVPMLELFGLILAWSAVSLSGFSL